MQQLSERDVRVQKIEKMKKLWVVPFAQHFDKEQSIAKIVDEYSNKEMREIEIIIPAPEKQVKTAWRLMLYRSFGKLSFWTIMDGSEKIQVMFHRDNCKIDISTSADEPKLVDSLWEWEEAMTAYKFMVPQRPCHHSRVESTAGGEVLAAPARHCLWRLGLSQSRSHGW